MILDIAAPDGTDYLLKNVERTHYVDDDLHVHFTNIENPNVIDHVDGQILFTNIENPKIIDSVDGQKPTIAMTYDDRETFDEYGPDREIYNE